MIQIARGSSYTFTSPAFEEYEGGPAIQPLDPSTYPSFVITDPDGNIVQQGLCRPVNDRYYTTYFHVPADATLSSSEATWTITWTMVSATNRQIEAAMDFDIVDSVDVAADERAYTYLTRPGKSERLLLRLNSRPEELGVTVIRANGNTFYESTKFARVDIPALDDEIQEIVQDSQYVYYIDTPALTSAEEYTVLWDYRETTVSPAETSQQVLRVPPNGAWKWFTPLRMLIDKLQKKQGRPQAYTDSDIWEYLQRGADLINGHYPASSWTVGSFPTVCGLPGYLIEGAAIWALTAQYLMAGELQFCFVGDTLVLTPEGEIKIKELVGEKVPGFYNKEIELVTPDGIRKTEKVYVSEPKEVFRVKTADNEVVCTLNEPFLTLTENLDLKWVNVADLKIGDYVTINKGEFSDGHYTDEFLTNLLRTFPELENNIDTLFRYQFHFESVTSIEPAGTETVYDLCLPDNDDRLNHAFIANGFVVHNSFGGQTVTLDLDHTGYYESARSMLMDHINENLKQAKLCALRRSGLGSVGVRPYDYGVSTYTRRISTGSAYGLTPIYALLDLE